MPVLDALAHALYVLGDVVDPTSEMDKDAAASLRALAEVLGRYPALEWEYAADDIAAHDDAESPMARTIRALAQVLGEAPRS